MAESLMDLTRSQYLSFWFSLYDIAHRLPHACLGLKPGWMNFTRMQKPSLALRNSRFFLQFLR